MSNVFDDPNGSFLVLVNHEGQFSLWPAFLEIPAGWTSNFGPDNKERCLDHIEHTWTDMRPKSLIAAMEQQAGH